MKFKWLNKNQNKNLIVFFNGWGMDEKIVSNLDSSGFDIIMFYDYRSFDMPDFDFSSYEKKYLIAWSMGVFVCNLFCDTFCNFDKFIAVNGTQKPIDDNFGIPKVIYNLTVKNFNELSCMKFMKKISNDVDLRSLCSRSNDDLKEELIKISNIQPISYLKFNLAFVSLNDKIFPPKNQINFWNNENVPIIKLEFGHSIFDKLSSWSEFI